MQIFLAPVGYEECFKSQVVYLVCPIIILHSLAVAVDLVTSGQVRVIAGVGLEAAHTSVRHRVNGFGQIGRALQDNFFGKLLGVSRVTGNKFSKAGKSVVDGGVCER